MHTRAQIFFSIQCLFFLCFFLLRIFVDAAKHLEPKQELIQNQPISNGKPQGLVFEPSTIIGMVDGRALQLHEVAIPGKPLLLIYLSVGCKHCEILIPDINGFVRGFAQEFPIIVISNSSAIGLREPATVVIDIEERFFNQIGAVAKPFGLVLNGTSLKVASPVAYGPNKIRALFLLVLNARSVTA